jgi:hypothetical protein
VGAPRPCGATRSPFGQKWLAPIADRVGVRLLGRDIRRRIDAFAMACADPTVLAAVAHTT